MPGRGRRNKQNDEGDRLTRTRNKIDEKKQQNKKKRQPYMKKKSVATTDSQISKPQTMTVDETEKTEDPIEKDGKTQPKDEKKANQTITLPEESSNVETHDPSDLSKLAHAPSARTVTPILPVKPPSPSPLCRANSILVRLLRKSFDLERHQEYQEPVHVMKHNIEPAKYM